jgi:hypothetical protein
MESDVSKAGTVSGSASCQPPMESDVSKAGTVSESAACLEIAAPAL